MEVVLSEGLGYFILLGVGLVMALAVILLVRVETKWLGTKKTFEWFSTAGRSVKVGLIASSVVSAWTWAATLLQSSTVAYQFGVSGPFWYAAGASIQVVLFAILATELKRKAPSSHTFPEIIYARFGKGSHKVFLFFALMTNTVVTAMLVLGGAAALSSLTGINISLAAFLIPIGVIIYTFSGGLKATFLAEYMNTVFLFIVVLVFVTAVYFIDPKIGGISGMFEKLSTAAALRPVEGNATGSYLTLASTGALIFGVINIAGNFGTVFVDQAYWQRAIAAGPRSAFKGFLAGGLAWFAIPFTLATTLGLAAVAVNVQLTPEEISMGLVAPTAASHVLGELGAILMLTILFTAVTAAGSAELVAVSSLVTYDVYRTYLKPSASGRELMRISRYSIVAFGIGMGVLALVLLQIGVSLQYVYLAMGVLIGSAVVPVTLVLWKKTNRVAATAGALAGLVCGVSVWVGTAYVLYGEISVHSTGHDIPLLAGNLSSIFVGAAVALIGSTIRPSNFDLSLMKQKILVVDGKIKGLFESENEEYLKKSLKVGYKAAIALTLVLVVAWPMPLYLSGYVFTETTYTIWVGIAVAWAGSAAAVIIFLPLIEARVGITKVLHIMGQKTNAIATQDMEGPPKPAATSDELYYAKRILVPIDGSGQSLRALNYATNIYGINEAKIYLLYVIEWPEEESDESVDEELTSRMEKEGRILLNSVIVPRRAGEYVRIVKMGDPASKIVEVAEKIGASMIVMGINGINNRAAEMGSVTRKVLKTSSTPVVLMK
ncbi:sodium:solute symporter family transporter [Nitrososphaera viennensis]|uniref:Urea active transporter, urea/sodium symporter n=2 Tax=Nitrososphaera viennensis TaxID=1034015 RepID=A0A060HKA1_9ARCH|nr:sodium/solute symporter [Nitrososphaera viennensis]AIC15720.1 urea active transporter, urea/sodium symporter [Nitrososphaera viennensis EN76]UVS70593.1 sodium/solute symporter [Nitrososphaera viennensis]